MAQAQHQARVKVASEKLYKTILAFEEYPHFVSGCEQVDLQKDSKGGLLVTQHVEILSKKLSYTISVQENLSARWVKWKLKKSDFFTKNNGSWQLKPVSDSETDVTYSLELEFKVGVPKFILNKLIKGMLPSMVQSFEKRASLL